MDFSDIVDERWCQEVPILGQAVAVESLLGGDFHGHLQAVVDGVYIVLPTARDDVPVAAGGIAAGVGVAEVAVVVGPAGIDKAFAYVNPPFGLRVRIVARGEAVPGIVHHLGSAVEVCTQTEPVLREVVNHGLILLRDSGFGREEWIGEVAVEVDAVGILALRPPYGGVAVVIGAVGVGQRIDTDAGAVH